MTPRTNDNSDDDDFVAFLNLHDTFDSTANTASNLMLEQMTPMHHTTNKHYNATTTMMKNPTTMHMIDNDANDGNFFTFLTLPETVASKENDANRTVNRATPPQPTIDDKDDATTTMPLTTKHNTRMQHPLTLLMILQPPPYNLQMLLDSMKQQYMDDINTCTQKLMMPMPMTLLAPQDKSECLNAMALPELAFPRTWPMMTNPSNPFNMPQPPNGPPQLTGPIIA